MGLLKAKYPFEKLLKSIPRLDVYLFMEMPHQFIAEKFSSGQLIGGPSFCNQSELLCKDSRLFE